MSCFIMFIKMYEKNNIKNTSLLNTKNNLKPQQLLKHRLIYQ